MKTIIFAFTFAALCFAPLSSADYNADIKALTDRVQELAESKAGLTDSERFEELVQISYEYTMLNFPEFATFLGDPRGQDRWSDQSEAATRQRKKDAVLLVAALDNIDREALSASEQVNFDLLYDSRKRDIEGQQFPGEFMPHFTAAQFMAQFLPSG